MRRSQETPLQSTKKARGDEQGRAPPASALVQPALPPHMAHGDASWSAFRPTFPAFVPQQPVSETDHPQLNRDIQRGLSINFYANPNPLMVASWATFFRDQYLRGVAQAQAQESSTVPRTHNYNGQQQQQQRQEQEVHWRRDVDSFFRDVLASKVLRSPHMEHVFQQMPFSESKAFSTAVYQIIFQKGTVLAGHAFDRLDWQEFLWHVGGLQVMVKQARIGHLNQYYGPKICRIVDEFIDRSSSEVGFNTDKFYQAALLLSASENAMNTPTAYGKIKSLYAIIIANSKPRNSQGGAEDSAEQGDIHSDLEGKTVRHFFTLEEEAFILAVTRRHLRNSKAGSYNKKSTTYLLWDENHSRELCNMLAHQETQQGKGARLATFHFPKTSNLTVRETTDDKPEAAAVEASPSREAEESLSSPASSNTRVLRRSKRAKAC